MSFTVYKSSAGSGKTFTLVKEYLRLILPEPNHFRHILAITFTNKAAKEMKDRVLESLRELAGLVQSRSSTIRDHLLPVLINETNLTEAEIKIKAGEALSLILHDYSDFSIGTIDSFSHRIIRAFAHDFGLPVNFVVEVDSDELLTTAVDLLIDKVGADTDLTALLVRFIETRMDDEHDWNIEKILLNFARILLDEEGNEELTKLKDLSLDDFSRIAGLLKKQIAVFEQKIVEQASKGTLIIKNSHIPVTAFFQGKSGISNYFEKLSKGKIDAIEPNSFVRKTIEEDKWTSGSAILADKTAIMDIKFNLIAIFEEINHTYETGKNLYHLSQAVIKTLFPMAVLNVISQLLDGFKKQNNIVHISEFNQRISRFILHEPIPFIYERLGEKFNHILIDEFQDTSILQWQNLLPLVENSLSSGYFNLVVGDGKQAIYRWRNGDVRQFADLPSIPGSEMNNLLKHREKVIKDHFTKEALDTNFRSKKEIVEFNNSFFSHLKTLLNSPSNQMVYDDPWQKVKKGADGGFIHLEFIGTELKGAQFREYMVSLLLKTIREQEADGFRKQDIAILCRRNKEGSDIARILLNNDIDVISAESLMLIHSPEVNFLIGFLHFLFGSRNVVLLAELVTYLYAKGKLAAPDLNSVLSNLTSFSGKNFVFKLLQENKIYIYPDKLRGRPVYDAIEELIRIFYPESIDPYLQFFLDIVLTYSRKNSSSAVDFLDWWDKHKDSFSIIMPDGMDAVRVMSIHKAKGLQFPVVILPFFTEKRMLTKRFLWVELPKTGFYGLPSAMLETNGSIGKTEFNEKAREEKDKSLLDNINVLYVAMTRPEERLFVFSPSPPVKSEGIESVPLFFQHYLQNDGLWSAERNVYEYGKAERFQLKENDKTMTKRTLGSVISSDWRGKLLIRSNAPKAWDIEDPQKNFQWGNLVHTALSRIIKAGDEENILQKMHDEGLLDKLQMEQLLTKVKYMISDPLICPFFLPGTNIRVEAEILRENGQVYRPDRVIIRENEAIILDFKTGKPKADQEKQINLYGRLMNELGYSEVKKYLIFIEPEIKVKEVFSEY